MYPLLLMMLALTACSSPASDAPRPDRTAATRSERHRTPMAPSDPATRSDRLGVAPRDYDAPTRDPLGRGALTTVDNEPLVLEHTDVQASIAAGLAIVRVTQDFHNPFSDPIDVHYVLPLPPDAAVRGFELICGERVIQGEIHDKRAAREIYEEARRDGRKAALLEQMRGNLFTQEVAGICPDEDVSVAVEYVQQIPREQGRSVLVFPTTVGERYEPTPDLKVPNHVPAPERGGRDLSITVAIDEGMPVESLWSDTHAIEVLEERTDGVFVSLDPSDAVPNKDFVLSWTRAGDSPRGSATVLPADGDEAGYLALTLEPQVLEDLAHQRKRELLFVMDSSCSMSGTPWDTSVATVRRALDEMTDDDTFNLVLFSSGASAIFSEPQPATAANITRAQRWLGGAFQGGGTDMDSGIRYSLTMPGDPEALRLMLILSDGYIGDDRSIVETVEANLGEARIFSLGVGSSVNRLLLENLAEVGRGAVDYQLGDKPIDQTVESFYSRIAHPAMTDLELDFGDLEVWDVYPTRIPDLWAGQPLQVVARYRGDGGREVRLSGRVGGESYQMRMPVSVEEGAVHEAVRTLWGRRKIHDIQWDLALTPDERIAQMTPVALEYHLVSEATSLVAVETRPGNCAASHAVAVDHYGPAGTRMDTAAPSAPRRRPSPKPRPARPYPSAPSVAPAPAPQPSMAPGPEPAPVRVASISSLTVSAGMQIAPIQTRLQRLARGLGQCLADAGHTSVELTVHLDETGATTAIEGAPANVARCLEATLKPVNFGQGPGSFSLKISV